jgi:hypothetical protein
MINRSDQLHTIRNTEIACAALEICSIIAKAGRVPAGANDQYLGQNSGLPHLR